MVSHAWDEIPQRCPCFGGLILGSCNSKLAIGVSLVVTTGESRPEAGGPPNQGLRTHWAVFEPPSMWLFVG